tara:strand:- start:1884 stop:2516 length:633 start_codon:yes stop_codon:yes gene_type:complete
MKNINAIIFDLGAVILNINYQKTIEEFKKLGVENPAYLYSKKTQTNLFNQLEIGKISEDYFLKKMQKKTNKASFYQIKNAWNAMLLDLPKNRMNLIRKLRKEYQIYLLSNTNIIHINKLKKNLGKKKYNNFYNLFDKVYYSHTIGFRKPDKEAFLLILKNHNLNPKKVLFIDDSPQHITGAKNIGINTHHLKSNQDITTLFPDITLPEHH